MKMRDIDLGRASCGFCMTGHHDMCKPEIKWYDKVWYCYCSECYPDGQPLEQKDNDNNTEGNI
jgi:hypothetical protein